MDWLVLAMMALGVLFGGPILAIVALVRLRRAEARIRTLEQDLARAGRETQRVAGRIAALEGARTTPADADVASPGIAVVEPGPLVAPPPVVREPQARPAATIPARPVAPRPPASESTAPRPAVRPTPVIRPTAAAPAAAAAPRLAGIDWERWVGIRGAAVLGTLALGLAGLLFFQYSIEHGLISPAMRVVLGALAGGGCLGFAAVLRRRGFAFTADGVAGAGVVILYAASWAAHMRYGLVPMSVAFVLMALVTAVCCLLAVRHRSQLTAVAGLLGGFATPLLLSSGYDRPLGLFGYVLLLDCGLLFVGRRGRWPSLALLSLGGTALLELLWIGGRMAPERLFVGMLILVGFAALFAFPSRLTGEDADRGPGLWTRLGAVGVPFAFAMYFAARVDLGPHLYPVGIFLAILAAAAAWMARELKQARISAGAAGACVTVVGLWLVRHQLTPALGWETVAVVVGLSALFHAFCEFEPKRPAGEGPGPAALVSVGGFFALLLLVATGGMGPVWPLVAGWAALTALAYRQAAFEGRSLLQPAATVASAIGLTALHVRPQGPLVSSAIFLTLLVAGAAGLFFLASVRRRDLRRSAMHAAAAFAAIVLACLPTGFVRVLPPLTALGVAALLGAIVAAAATWLRRGVWYAAAVGCTLVAQVGWMIVRPGAMQYVALTTTAFFVMLGTVVALTAWPFATGGRFDAQPAAWRAAALAGPLALAPLCLLFVATWGVGSIGLLPVALGLLAFGGAAAAYRLQGGDDGATRGALVWFAGVAACLFAVAVPLQFAREWITVGWALQGLALVAVWKRLDHPGLKYLALALLGAATLRLVANPALLYYHARSATPVLNWMLYTYLVPAGALLGGALLLRRLEVARARNWERWLYAGGHAAGALAAGFAAIAVVFAWINLAIADWFATGARFTLDLGGDPAQRLTVSIAWAVYAVVLLSLGMARRALGLRWLSLGFLIVTIGKVFLYDLSALEDLYRVASLVGLAVSLILVSVLYQRFVFGKRTARSGT